LIGVLAFSGAVSGAACVIESLHGERARLDRLAAGALASALGFVWEEHVSGLEDVLAGA
jgi:hypothetical protein